MITNLFQSFIKNEENEINTHINNNLSNLNEHNIELFFYILKTSTK